MPVPKKPSLNSDEEIDRLCKNNKGLCYSALGMIKRKYRNADDDVMLGLAFEALWDAARLFDKARGFKFSTYSMNAMLRRMSRECQRGMNLKRVIRAKTLHSSKPGASGHDLRYDAPARPSTLSEILKLEDHEQDLEWLRGQLKAIGTRNAKSLLLYYGEGLTLEKVGVELGLTKERIRQMNKQSMERLEVSLRRRRRRLANPRKPRTKFREKTLRNSENAAEAAA